MNDHYVVRSLGTAARTAIPALVFLAVCAAYSLLREDFGFLGVVVPLLAVVTVVQVGRTWTLLRVDRAGVAMTVPATSWYAGPVLREAPWTSVWRMELDAAERTVAVVLRPDAPPPGWPTELGDTGRSQERCPLRAPRAGPRRAHLRVGGAQRRARHAGAAQRLRAESPARSSRPTRRTGRQVRPSRF